MSYRKSRKTKRRIQRAVDKIENPKAERNKDRVCRYTTCGHKIRHYIYPVSGAKFFKHLASVSGGYCGLHYREYMCRYEGQMKVITRNDYDSISAVLAILDSLR